MTKIGIKLIRKYSVKTNILLIPTIPNFLHYSLTAEYHGIKKCFIYCPD